MRKRTETIVRECAAKVGGLAMLERACLYLALRDQWQEEKDDRTLDTPRAFKDFVEACIQPYIEDHGDASERIVDDFSESLGWHTSND